MYAYHNGPPLVNTYTNSGKGCEINSGKASGMRCGRSSDASSAQSRSPSVGDPERVLAAQSFLMCSKTRTCSNTKRMFEHAERYVISIHYICIYIILIHIYIYVYVIYIYLFTFIDIPIDIFIDILFNYCLLIADNGFRKGFRHEMRKEFRREWRAKPKPKCGAP